MRIAQVAPLIESVPPSGYGGTERVVSYLTEELVRQGHDVTLFASGDSTTAARLVPVTPRALAPGRRDLRPGRPPDRGAGAGRGAGRPLRRHPLAPRLLPLPDVAPARRPAAHDAAWPARHPGSAARLRRVSRHAARLDLQRPARAAPSGPLGRARSTTGFRPTSSSPPTRRATTSPSWDGSRRRSVPTAPSKSRDGSGCHSASAPRSIPSDQTYFEENIEPLHRPRSRRVGGRGRRPGEGRPPAACRRPHLPDRLGRALRAGDDRGHGLRHAGRRLRVGIGARGDR